MSLATLASKLYTVKSRKNLSFNSAFSSMVREDLAMRFSVFNITKAITGSDFIAAVMQSKYGKLTPIEKEEKTLEKKKTAQEKRFKQFTVNSIVTLNNKITTLTAITERNSALILNLYNDLGFFKNQRKDQLSQISSLTAVRTKIKSRTVKYQIDELRAQIDLLQQVTVGKKISRRIKQVAAAGGALGAIGATAAAGSGGAGAPPTSTTPSTLDDISKSVSLSDVLNAAGAAGILGAGYRFIRKKYFPTPSTGTATPVKPTTTSTATKTPKISSQPRVPKGQPGAGQFTKAIGTSRGPGTTSSAVLRQNMPSSRLAGLMRRLPPGLSKVLFGAGRILGTGPQTIATIMGGAGYMASGAAGKDVISDIEERLKPFGIKFLRAADGTPIYDINGVQYTSQNLPVEYQTILDAYVGDTRSASARAAKQKIETAPALYNSLIVEGPPLFAESDTAMRVVAAAKAAQLTMPEPVVAAPAVSAPTPPSRIETKTNFGVPDLSKLTVYNSIDFNAFAKKIAELESGNRYDAVNSLGYLGKYQFGALALQDVGLVKQGTTLKGLDDPNNWNIAGGKQAFLKNPELQEKTFQKYTYLNYTTLNRINVIKADSPPDQVAGFLAAAHLVGPVGAKQLMIGVDTADAYGSKASRYYASGAGTQKTYVASKPGAERFVPTSTPGVYVSAPPPVASAATPAATSTEVAEIQSLAALEVGQSSQQAITVLASRVSILEGKLLQDSPFASVRNLNSAIPVA